MAWTFNVRRGEKGRYWVKQGKKKTFYKSKSAAVKSMDKHLLRHPFTTWGYIHRGRKRRY